MSHVIRQGGVTLVFQSALNPNNAAMTAHLGKHGDGVRDVALTVDDARAVWKVCLSVFAAMWVFVKRGMALR